MVLPSGIGPHEGHELELMLKGKKHCAIFHDAVTESGFIPETIIPEAAFAPFVAKGSVSRFSRDFKDSKTSHIIRFVCFTACGHEWRAHFLLWLKERRYSGIKTDDADDVLEGRVLGYSENEIASYLTHKKSGFGSAIGA